VRTEELLGILQHPVAIAELGKDAVVLKELVQALDGALQMLRQVKRGVQGSGWG
jgi:hypothetical protein